MDHSRSGSLAGDPRPSSAVLAQAFAALDREFGRPGWQARQTKRWARRFIRLSYGHAETRARYAYYAELIVDYDLSLDAAVCALALDCVRPHPGETGNLPRMIRQELHLILRWLRRKNMHAAFADLVAARRAGASHQGERVMAAAE